MKRLLTAVIIATAAALTLTGAHATPVYYSVTATATETEQYGTSSGGPSFSTSSQLSTTHENVSASVEFSPITTFSSAYSFTLAPQSSCSGSGCSTAIDGVHKLETDTITLKFTNVVVNGHTLPTFTEIGTFSAQYGGAILACAKGDKVSPDPGDTDCLVWAGAPNTYNGSTSLFEPIPGMPGDDLEVTFFNATDWNVSPSFKVAVVDAPAPVPEPASFALLGFGLLGTVAFVRRRRA